MRFPSMLRRLRNTQGGIGSTAKSASTPYTPEPSTLEVRVFGNPQTVSVGTEVQFTASVSNAPGDVDLIHSWTFDDGATSKTRNGLKASCVYTTPGDKTVTLTVSYTNTDGEIVEAYGSVTITVDPCLSLSGETEPPWLTEARTHLGLHESDEAAQAKFKTLFESGGFNDLDPAATSWCAAFVGSVLGKSGLGHTGSKSSRSYRTWGDPCEERVGAVVVFGSHVGFVSSPGMVLGGNQSDEVNIRKYSWLKVAPPLFFRWPSECPCPDEADESGETNGASSE